MKKHVVKGAVARLIILLAVCAVIAAAYIIAASKGALPAVMNDGQLNAEYAITSED